MSTKSKLVQSLDRYSNYRSGPYHRRKKRIGIMKGIVNDLYEARLLPREWDHLNEATIKKLVLFWQYQKKLKTSTIMARLSAFRHFCGFYKVDFIFPSNIALGLKVKKKAKILNNTNPVFTDNPAHIILALSYYFGLTHKETMLLNPLLHLYQGNIMLTRNVAFNYKERNIPIVTEAQKHLIEQWKTSLTTHSLLKQYGYQRLNKWVREALTTSGASTNQQYRHAYIVYRLETLNLLPVKAQKKKLIEEMGLSRPQFQSYWRALFPHE